MLQSKKILSTCWITCVCLVGGCACRIHSVVATQPVTPALTLSYVQTADPVADVDREMRLHQLQFVGLVEMGEFVPGVENDPMLVKRYGVKYIAGADDTAPKGQEDNAREYAEIFNLVAARRLRRQSID